MSNEESLSLLERQVAIPSRRRMWLFLFSCVAASMIGAAFVVTQSLKEVNVNVRVHQQSQEEPAATLAAASTSCAGQLCACLTTSINAVVDESEVQRLLSEDGPRGPRIVPSFAGGVAVGFKLYAIAPDSIWSRIGLVNGDTIHTVQGIDLHSPEQAMKLYHKLTRESPAQIHVELSRAGCPATLDLSVLAD